MKKFWIWMMALGLVMIFGTMACVDAEGNDDGFAEEEEGEDEGGVEDEGEGGMVSGVGPVSNDVDASAAHPRSFPLCFTDEDCGMGNSCIGKECVPRFQTPFPIEPWDPFHLDL
ncbi:MAG: hypothetical protein MUC50_17805 [Myxococcota bacterium]|jgi:hypothetical protein|nr:hypothetical protein [Myxococcota bacterium]